ncbi:hypothetical protein Taro_031786 [Colocasia esculenta]|uniref:Uncharacterized protein n=1 Tax=Colocasia esculenta TaxID=4460 RepID=A0A843W7G1_COLES|nr:hypothetical protein [Colocasia esculenta]
MEVLRPVPKQTLGISLTKGTVPLKDDTTPSTPAGLLLFPEQEGNPLLLQVKKPTSWYKLQCGSARHKPLARFYTVYSPTAGQKVFLIKERTLLRVKKPTSWYKPQCGSARHKPLARFYTVYSPIAGQKVFLIKERTLLRVLQDWTLTKTLNKRLSQELQ